MARMAPEGSTGGRNNRSVLACSSGRTEPLEDWLLSGMGGKADIREAEMRSVRTRFVEADESARQGAPVDLKYYVR